MDRSYREGYRQGLRDAERDIGRDFGNPKMLIDILSNYKPSMFSDSRRILEKVITLNFNFK